MKKNNEYIIFNNDATDFGTPIADLVVFICKELAKEYKIQDFTELFHFIFTHDGHDIFIDYAMDRYNLELEYWSWKNEDTERIVGQGFKFWKTESLTKLMLASPWKNVKS